MATTILGVLGDAALGLAKDAVIGLKNTIVNSVTFNNNSQKIMQGLKREYSGNKKELLLVWIFKEISALYPNINDRILMGIIEDVAMEFGANRYDTGSTVEYQKVLPNMSDKEILRLMQHIKFCSNTNRGRIQSVEYNWPWYIWRGKSCNLHNHMEGVFVRWDMPPSPELLRDGSPIPHHAGSQFGCRCWPEICISPENVKSRKNYKICCGNSIRIEHTKGFLR